MPKRGPSGEPCVLCGSSTKLVYIEPNGGEVDAPTWWERCRNQQCRCQVASSLPEPERLRRSGYAALPGFE